MKKNWNKEGLKRHYLRIVDDAKKHGYTDEELERPYLDKLSHQTKSGRIMRMISLAYYLGKLKGVAEVDEGLTPITLRSDIEQFEEPCGCAYCNMEPDTFGHTLLYVECGASVQYYRDKDGEYYLAHSEDDAKRKRIHYCLSCGRPL